MRLQNPCFGKHSTKFLKFKYNTFTVAILAQGTSLANALAQAFFALCAEFLKSFFEDYILITLNFISWRHLSLWPCLRCALHLGVSCVTRGYHYPNNLVAGMEGGMQISPCWPIMIWGSAQAGNRAD